uniref:Variant surface glycoprotein n=1 Tax=Trypanosoma brucei TaxID=5691 RepID=A0A1V0G0F8_9TRYP|nr:variant surface glycoprotein [Trypanosoma brucei]
MMSMSIAITTTLVVTLATRDAALAVTDGDNAHLLPALCAALQLGDGTPTYEPQLPEALAAPATLYRLNISLANPRWVATLTQTTPGNTNPTKAQGPEGAGAPSPADWDRWAEAAEYVANPANRQHLKGECDVSLLGAEQKQRLKEDVETLAETALQIFSTATAAQATNLKQDTELTEMLKVGIYGDKATTVTAPENAKIFEGTTFTYSAACATGTTSSAKKSLAAAIWCVCGSGNGNNKKPCSKTQTTVADFSSSGAPDPTKWQHFRQICPINPPTKLTATTLRIIANQLTSSIIGADASNSYIGIYHTGDCDGNSNGACAKLTDTISSGKLDSSKILWIKALTDIADELEKRQRAAEQQDDARRALKHLKEMTKAACSRARYKEENKQQAHQPAVTTGGPIQQQQDKAEKKCNAIEEQEKCDATPGCHYNKTKDGKKCTMSEEGKNEAEKAGENNGKTDCKKHDNKKNCKKENDGLAANAPRNVDG